MACLASSLLNEEDEAPPTVAAVVAHSLPDLFSLLLKRCDQQCQQTTDLLTVQTTFCGDSSRRIPQYQIIAHFIDAAADHYGFTHFSSFHFPSSSHLQGKNGVAEYKLTVPTSSSSSPTNSSYMQITLHWNHNLVDDAAEIQASITCETY
jgi:hypothetical protein